MRKLSATLTILILTSLLVPAVVAQGTALDVVGKDPVGQPVPPTAPVAVAPHPEDVLWDNGPLVTHPGDCSGQDASRLQNSSLGMEILGFGHQYQSGHRIADEFEIIDPVGWHVDQITFFAYQTNAPMDPSPIIGLYFQIWDGSPADPGSSVVFGDLVTNRLASSTFSGIQRDRETVTCTNNRYIFADVGTVGATLGPGTYWLDWMTDGNLPSGPYAAPITITGQTTTGNALQYTTAWAPALDTGSGTQQGMPFIIEGTIVGGVPNDECSNAKVINTNSYSDVMDTTEATTAPDDPETTCGSSANPQQSNSVWYSFTAAEDGLAYVATCGSQYDTVLAMFEGPCGAPWTEIGCSDDSCGVQSELFDVPLVGGTTYLIEVTAHDEGVGGLLDFYFEFTPSAEPDIRIFLPLVVRNH